ncbi:response regulator [Kouleothrix sp.]|uniref:response regulator n=1 Tax=Kouleothrix sp. TaxID=2779161 RepID=UPI00391AE713
MAWILIVDDEQVLVEMIASLIEDMGLHPMTAANGEEALRQLLATSQTPALVISDIMMPRMNGLELARAVKHHPGLKSVPIILMSAAGQPSSSDLADGFIPKPFDLEILSGLIEQHLASRLRAQERVA